MNATQNPMDVIRGHYPAIRRTGPTAIIHSGSSRTVFGCLCGSRHTCSTEWDGRHAKHVKEWQAQHAGCAARLAEKLEAGEEVEIYYGQ